MNRFKGLKVCSSLEELSFRAAELFSVLAAKAVKERGVFAAVLSGGRTPELLYEILASVYKDKIPWEKVHLFWGDERCVGPEDRKSNYRLAREALTSKVAIPSRNVHRMKGELEPEEAARLYEEEIRRFFGLKALAAPAFDLVIIGLGEDGHTLSLFPFTKALEERKRLVAANYVEAIGAYRITMTLPAVNNARTVVFLVSGREKAPALREAFSGRGNGSPARRIRPVKGELKWFVDREAAGLLAGC